AEYMSRFIMVAVLVIFCCFWEARCLFINDLRAQNCKFDQFRAKLGLWLFACRFALLFSVLI
ncbi:MAG: hypothetical protein Q8M98_08780, partial [Candidatus Cloacimonadaceae bacterium]|nr:hypothetical protein [Candidatus Cloacimonadaceae bacterium]